jgi:hypothetical protein
MEARKLPKPRARPFQLSLRIRHPSLDPSELSREFQIQAVHSFRAGDPRPSRSGLTSASVHTESYWLGALNPAGPAGAGAPSLAIPEPFLEMMASRKALATTTNSLGWALFLSARQFFTTHAQALRRIGREGGQIALLVTLSPGEVSGFSLSPHVGRVLSELGVAIEFEFAND